MKNEENDKTVTLKNSEAIYGGSPEAEQGVATETPPGPDVAALIAEAEQRGYLRGRNEMAEAAMKAPGMWENMASFASQRAADKDVADELTENFLTKLRPTVWD